MPRSASRTGTERQAAGARRRVDGAGEDRRRPRRGRPRAGGRALGVEHRRAVRAGRAEPVPARSARRGASARARRGTGAPAGRPACASIVLPSASVPGGGRPLRRGRPALGRRPARPTSAYISAPCTAIAGWRSIRSFASNHSIQRSTVSQRPLAQTGLASCRTRRATRSASPAAWAWSMAASGMPLRLVPRRGPEVELGDHLRLAPPQLGQQQLAEQVVVAVPLPAPVERDDQQVAALQPLEDRARSRRRRASRRTAGRTCARGSTCG